MSNYRSAIFALFAVVLLVLGLADDMTAQQRSNLREVRDIVRSLNSKVDDFEYNLTYRLQTTSTDRDTVDEVRADLRDLKDKLTNFERNIDQQRENRDDVSDIISSASSIDDFLLSNRQNQRISAEWAEVRALLERLASNYGISTDRTSTAMQTPRDADPIDYPVTGNVIGNGSALAGAYSLDTARSENTEQIVDQTNLSDANRRDLESKLVAPQQITLEIRGNQVTLGSSNSSPVTFVADGRETSERDSTGRTVRVRATLKGDELRMSSIGGDTDYTIIFTPQDNGRSLKVTRRVTVDYLPHTVFADSFYTRTSAYSQTRTSDPDDSGYSSNDPADRSSNSGTYGGNPRTFPARTGDHIVPNGTIITGLLENEIDTQVSQNNDRFRLTVQSPAEFRGAILEGYLTGVGRSGQISGRSNVTFNFERITLRNGQSYDFAGFLQSIRDQNGKTVRVDTEGTARGDSQTKETIKRGGIGAGIGAIIGAIAGGGKGAAIGAIIGGGAGAGSVIVQGRDDLHLMKGSILTIQSSSPVGSSSLPRDN